jgi:hypothetical protein
MNLVIRDGTSVTAMMENLPSATTSHTSTTWAGTENRLPVGNDDLRSGC